MGYRYFVYILANRRNGTLYVGVTNDLARRMAEHKGGFVPGFTERYGIDKLVYVEEYGSILEARARERAGRGRLRSSRSSIRNGVTFRTRLPEARCG